ncbi:MAG: NAD(P)/FAD-dependent oxidoreductase [Verrucomicrobiales bacterium]|nr:NAD(P)/FAD-dependent oxidoreductase [Verrucomicrobiales bacterium]
MPNPQNLTTTVAIIGGGPAGSTLATYLGSAGIDHVLIERETFPRHHIGESLIATTTAIFAELGILDQMDAAGFVRKHGAVWTPNSGKGAHALKLSPPPEFGRDYTYQVERAQFDKLLLDNAVSNGTRLIQPAKVTGVLQDDTDRVTGLTVRQEDGSITQINARFVADASGQATVLGSKFGLRQNDTQFNQVALYAYFENVDRGPEEQQDYIHIYFLKAARAWVWQIPISDTLTSVGVVSRHEDFKQARADGASAEQYFQDCVDSNPAIAQRLSNARRTEDFRTVSNYSFRMSQIAGPGFVLVGDAARFVDPIFSSGVGIAMTGAKFAFTAIQNAIADEAFETEAFATYESTIRKGTEIWYEFITIYYKLQNLFTHYVQKPEYRQHIIDLLQGSVYDDRAIDVLRSMREDIETIENNPDHLLHKALVQ